MRCTLADTLLSFALIVVTCSCGAQFDKSNVQKKGQELKARTDIVETLKEKCKKSGFHMTVGEVIDTLGPAKWKVIPQSTISMYQRDPIIFGLTLVREDSDGKYFVYLENEACVRNSEFSELMKDDGYRELIVVGGEYFDRSTNEFEYWGQTAVKIMEGDRPVGWLNQFTNNSGDSILNY